MSNKRIARERRAQERISVIQLGIMIFTVIIRVLFQMMIPIVARANYVDDDGLMVSYAQSIYDGKWLGTYSEHTLNKKPIFSVILAFFKIFNVPYMLWTGLLYALACVVFFYVIRKWLKSFTGSYFCMLFLMFSPVMFDDYIAQCVYRMSIVPAFVVVIVSAYLAIYFDRNQKVRGNLIWISLASVALGIYSLSREESSWIKCFVIGAIAVLFVLYIIENGFKLKEQIGYTIFLVMPLIVSMVFSVTLKTINYNKYGVFTETDFNDTYYEQVCKDIVSVKPRVYVANCYVTKETFYRCMDYSKTLNELRSAVDWYYNNPSTPALKNGELKSGNFAWVLRWSAGMMGVYSDAKTANEFYKKVHEELSKGFEDGTFDKKDAIILSGISRPIEKGDIKDILGYAFLGYNVMASYMDLGPKYKEPTGSYAQIRKMQNMTSTDITDTGIDGYEFSGWIFAKNNESSVRISIEDKSGNSILPTFKASETVYNNLKKSADMTYENAKNAAFSLHISANDNIDIGNLYIRVFLNEEEIFYDSIKNIKNLVNENIVYNIDKNSIVYKDTLSKDAYEKNIRFINGFLNVYKFTGLFVFCLAIVFFVADLASNITNKIVKKKTNFSFCILQLGLLLTIYANLLVISVVYFKSHSKTYIVKYAAGCIPVMQIFICLSICNYIIILKRFYKGDKKLENQTIKKDSGYEGLHYDDSEKTDTDDDDDIIFL